MGRHSAPVADVEQPRVDRNRIDQHRIDQHRMDQARSAAALQPQHDAGPGQRGPITDPRLFDSAPAASVQVAPVMTQRPTARPQAPAMKPQQPVATMAQPPFAAARPPVFRAPVPQSLGPVQTLGPVMDVTGFALDQDVEDDGFGDVVPASVALRPIAARVPGRAIDTGVIPIVRGRSLTTGRVDTRRSQPQPIKAKTPASFVRGREAALAACAVAVVGAVSGVAAILPATSSEAQTGTTQPMTSPTPTVSGGTGTAGQQVCFSPQELKRAMRHHHHHRPRPSAFPVVDGRFQPAGVRPAADPSASPTSTPTSTPSPSSSASTSPISTPSGGGTLPANPSNLGAGTYTVSDFSNQSSGALISGGTLQGAGVGKTVVEMVKDSSTKASVVPGNGNNQGGLANPTNPLYLLRGVTDVEGVTIQGTDQGHLYNGLYMTGADLMIKHVEIDDIPGNSNANPGETFAIGANRVTGTATVDDLTINGGSGSLASAGGLGINNSDANWNITDLTANNLKYSAGIALWQVRGTFNIHNYVQSGGARSLGAERMAGTVNLYDPVWSAGTTGHDVTYTWDGGYSGGSINFYYSSASKVPNRKITIITNKASGIAGSVHVYIGGVQQTTSDYVTVN